MSNARFQRTMRKTASKRRRSVRKQDSASRKLRALRQVANMRTGGLSGVETKYFDSAFSGIVDAEANMTSGVKDPLPSQSLFTPVEGSNATQRDGRRVQMKSIYVTGEVFDSAEPGKGYAKAVYIALVLDTQTNGAPLLSEQVFTNPSGAVACTTAPLRVLENTMRFKVLDSVRVELPADHFRNDAGNGTDTIWGIRPFKLSAKLRDMPVNFKANGGGIGDIVDNSFHIIAYCNDGTKAVLSYNCRSRFVG